LVEWSGVERSAVGNQLVQLGSYSEIGDSQRGHEAMNAEAEEAMALKPLPGDNREDTAEI
jgi:hypothetical protein